MATTIGKFDTVTSVFAGVSDIIVGDVAADSAYVSGTLDTLFANAKSVGQVKEDSTNWTGDDPTVDSVKDERGNIITTKTTAGTFAFEFLMASMSENILKAFMKASDVASVVGSTGPFGSEATGVKIVDLPVTVRPIMVVNDVADKCIVFPKAKIVASVTREDGVFFVKGTATAEFVDTTKLGTFMLLNGISLTY